MIVKCKFDLNYLNVSKDNSSLYSSVQVTIIFKPYQECTDQKVYQAVTDDLPAAFVDGTISGGDSETRSIWILEKTPGRHVEIHAAYIGVNIIIRQQGRYLTLAVRMPEELAMAFDETQDLQLCVNGCPTSERIDQEGHLHLPMQGLQQAGLQQQARAEAQRGVFTLESASRKCREQLEVKDIYFHSCVFDLLTTGDANFTTAAYNALKDMETLHPKRERWHIFPNSAPGLRPFSLLSHALLVVFLLAVLL